MIRQVFFQPCPQKIIMEKDQCFYLGKITKIVGFKGEIAVFIDSDEPENYSRIESVFVEFNSGLIPFFVEYIKARNKNNQFTIKFEDIDDHEEAARLQGCELYLPLAALPALEGNAFYFHEVEGFSVTDHLKGPVGTIIKVLDYPGNPLFEISHGDKIILVPLQDQFIEKVDRTTRQIFIKAPEGLIDLYLDGE